MSIDSDMNASFSSGSIDLGDLDNTPRVQTDRSAFGVDESQSENVISFKLQNKKGTPFPNQVQHSDMFPELSLELESVNSGAVSHVSNTEEFSKGGNSSMDLSQSTKEDNLEPLMPARLKPAKEKINNHTKEEERDETKRRKTPSPPKEKKRVMIDPQFAVINNSGEMTDRSDLTSVHQSFDTPRYDSGVLSQSGTEAKTFDAFFVRGSMTDSEDILTARSDVTVAESYVLEQGQAPETPEAARAAGIPVIDELNSTTRRLSREGSVASSKSSGDFSDHESQKIHADHKTQESLNKLNNNNSDFRRINDFSDPSRIIMQKPVIMSRTQKNVDMGGNGHATSFSQIKQMKELGQVDNSGFVYMQHGKDDQSKSTLKDTFQRKQQEKLLNSGAVPNQSGWQQTTSRPVANQNEASGESSTANGGVSQELLKIKMKLEEKRKAIERKKHTQEIQQQKIRQRLGKAAFLHVVAKPKDDSSVSSGGSEENMPSRMIMSDPEVPITSPASDTRSTASASPMRSPTNQKVSRSRGDIQQTIENIRKNWFNDEDLVAPRTMDRSECKSPEDYQSQNGGDTTDRDSGQTSARPIFDRRSTSVERVSSLGDQSRSERERSPLAVYDRRSISVERGMPSHVVAQAGYSPEQQVLPHSQSPPIIMDRRSSSTERSSRPDSRRDSGPRKKRDESVEYNHELDKLNQSLTDLQGEIMQLSLKKGTRNADITRSRSKSPPRVLSVTQNHPADDVSRPTERAQAQHYHQGQGRSASEPRQLVPEADQVEQPIGSYQSQTLPRPLHFQQGQIPQQYMMQPQTNIAGPTGPVYGTPNQYIPGPGQAGIPPTAQQYGSYIMGPGSAPPLGHLGHPQVNQQPFQHSPPQVYPPPSVPGMYPGQGYVTQPLVSPHCQPYSTIYASPPISQFSPSPHLAGTYTTPSHQHNVQYTPTSQPLPFDPVAQQQQQLYLQQQQQQQQFVHTGPTSVPQSIDTRPPQHIQNVTHTEQSVPSDTNDNVQEAPSDTGGFFVDMNQGSPRRLKSKPVLSDRPVKTESSDRNTSDYGSSVIADFAQNLNIGHSAETCQEPASVTSQPEPVPCRVQQNVVPTGGAVQERGETIDAPGQQDSSAVKFLVGQDESTLDQVR